MLSHFNRVRLCVTLETAAHQAPLSLGFFRQEHWSGLPFPSPMHESEKRKWSLSVVSYSERPHGLQATRVLHPWDFPGKSTGVGCQELAKGYIATQWELAKGYIATQWLRWAFTAGLSGSVVWLLPLGYCWGSWKSTIIATIREETEGSWTDLAEKSPCCICWVFLRL